MKYFELLQMVTELIKFTRNFARRVTVSSSRNFQTVPYLFMLLMIIIDCIQSKMKSVSSDCRYPPLMNPEQKRRVNFSNQPLAF